MIRYFIFILLTGTFLSANSQAVTLNIRYISKQDRSKSDTIYYTPSTRLAWSDFKGTPPSDSYAGAITASGFAYDANIHFDARDRMIMDVDVYCYFTKHDSWKKPGTNSAYHLEHEQHHFDITYLGAMDFINAAKKAKFTENNYNKLLADIFNKTYDKNTALQHKYDLETQHSINKTQQEEWNNKISKLIESIIALSK